MSALQLLAIWRSRREPLSRIASIFSPAPQKLVNIAVPAKPPLETVPAIREAEAAARQDLGHRGRTLIRYSGTQALCRVMVEGPEQAMVDRITDRLVQVVTAALC
jgi:phosphoglucosamine mutase